MVEKRGCFLQYNSKLVISGKFIEIYEYEKYQSDLKKESEEVISNFKLSFLNGEREEACYSDDGYLLQTNINPETGEITVSTEDRQKEFQKRSMLNIHRIINANLNQRRTSEKFYTLTFVENLQDREKAIKEFNKFVYKLRRKLVQKIDYLATIELQKRGAIHFHVLFFNLAYQENDVMEKLWGHGFVKIKSVKSEEVAFYILKYITKDVATGRVKGQRRYLHSRGLKKPVEIKTDDVLVKDFLIEQRAIIVANNTYSNDFVGGIKYTRIYLEKGVDIDVLYSKYKTE